LRLGHSSSQGAIILNSKELIMQTDDAKQLIKSIIDYSHENDQISFKVITSWQELRFNKGKRRSFKLLVKALRSGSKRLLKKYYKSVKAGNSDINKLLAYTQWLKVIDFYKKDLETINNMILEYETYLAEDLNFLWALTGEIRKDTTIRDYRK
jgi:hydroxymethylpyrimidine pyrophosphatase-like HAD family hydrolase